MGNVYAIIVTYQGLKWYKKCFDSLQDSTIPVKIIAVDNGSEDGSIDYINNNFPGIQLIPQGSNLGFGKANNRGIKEALKQNADYVFLLNQDARIEPETIEKLISVHKDQPGYGILSPMHFNGSGDEFDGGFKNYIGPEYTPMLLNDLSTNKLKDVYESRFVNAAAWLISSKSLTRVGGFDPIFFHYGEDYNYCQRAKYHGLKIGIVPGTKIYHDRTYYQEEYGSEQILRHYLLTVADINNPNYRASHKKLRQQDMIRMLTSLYRFNLHRFWSNWRNLQTKKKYYPLILQSRITNQQRGPAYIS